MATSTSLKTKVFFVESQEGLKHATVAVELHRDDLGGGRISRRVETTTGIAAYIDKIFYGRISRRVETYIDK